MTETFHSNMARLDHKNLLGWSHNAFSNSHQRHMIMYQMGAEGAYAPPPLPRIFRRTKSPAYPYTTTLIPYRKFCKLGHLFSGKPPKWIDYPNPNRCEEGFSNICNRTYASDQTDTWCLKDIYICDGHRHSILY